MRIKLYLMLGLFVFTLPVVSTSAAKGTGELSKEEILALLPSGIDMDDDNDIARYRRLVALGPAAHEVLGEELLRVEEFEPASRIVGIFEESKGDKAIAIKYLEKFLALPPRGGSSWQFVRTQATQTLSELRREQSLSNAKGTVNQASDLQNSPPTGTIEPKLETAMPKAAVALPVSTQQSSTTTPGVERKTYLFALLIGIVALVVAIAVVVKRGAWPGS